MNSTHSHPYTVDMSVFQLNQEIQNVVEVFSGQILFSQDETHCGSTSQLPASGHELNVTFYIVDKDRRIRADVEVFDFEEKWVAEDGVAEDSEHF